MFGLGRVQHERSSGGRVPAGSDAAGRFPHESRPKGVWTTSWLSMAFVVALFCVPLFVGLRATDLQNDEAGHSFTVDVMLENGDWLTPRASPREDVAFLEKPPLKFWIVAASIRLGLLPHNEFGLRFWDALFGSVAFLYLFAIGRMLGGPLCGFAAVLMLFVQRPLIFDHGLRSNDMEAMLVLAYCGGIYHFLRWRLSDLARARRHLIAISLYFAAAFMMKFVAALFLPAVIAAAILLRRDDRARLARDWRFVLAAVLLVVFLVAPWFLYQYYRRGPDLWQTMFSSQVVTRFRSYLDPDHVRPWHYYFSEVFAHLRAAGVVALTIAGMAALFVRAAWKRSPEAAAVLIWAAFPLAAISFGSSKLYHYAYPYLPPVALAGAYASTVLARAVAALLGLGSSSGTTWRTTRPRAWFRAVGVLLSFLAVVAIGVAAATYVNGHVLRLTVADGLLLQNTTIARPLLIALLLLALAGRTLAARRGLLVVLLLWALPVVAYREELSLLTVQNHPVRSACDCLQPIAARYGGPGRRGPGVYIEKQYLVHTFPYYLRRLGPSVPDDGPPEGGTYTALYVPSMTRPVLLSDAGYRDFMKRLAAQDPELIHRAARKAGIADDLIRQNQTPYVSLVRLYDKLLLLPGPYSACVEPLTAEAKTR